MNQKTIPLPAPLAQAIGEYLATKPYREVAGLLAGLQKAIDNGTSPPADGESRVTASGS